MGSITEEPGRRAAEGWDAIFVAALGPYGATLAWTVIWALCAVMLLVFGRYFVLLREGDKPQGSKERRDYDELRANLGAGGWPSQVYGRMLTAFLNGVDRFFNDVDRDGNANWRLSAFPRAFGLRTPATLWTAAAFDRCLLLALIYPVTCIFAIWAISGHVGPAESALGLSAHADPLRRAVAAGGLTLSLFAIWRFNRTSGWKKWSWYAVAGAGAIVVAGPGAIAFAFAFAGVFAVAFAVAFTAAFASAFPGAFASSVAVAGAVAIAGAVAGAVAVLFVSAFSIRIGRHGVFLSLFSMLMLSALLVAAAHANPLAARWTEVVGPVALFLGVLTLMNAPFDWLSLGFTRALLRRGVELKGWWPYALALVDLALAIGLLFPLAGAMVIGVQAFDYLAGLSGQPPVLPIGPLFEGIEHDPGAPQYWWVYATLFSTLIPSLFNLVIGSWSLTRGLPLLSRACASRMPEAAPTPLHDRAWISVVLTGQWVIGFALTLGALALLCWGVWSAFPRTGSAFLHWGEFVASLQVPQHINEWAIRLLRR